MCFPTPPLTPSPHVSPALLTPLRRARPLSTDVLPSHHEALGIYPPAAMGAIFPYGPLVLGSRDLERLIQNDCASLSGYKSSAAVVEL